MGKLVFHSGTNSFVDETVVLFNWLLCQFIKPDTTIHSDEGVSFKDLMNEDKLPNKENVPDTIDGVAVELANEIDSEEVKNEGDSEEVKNEEESPDNQDADEASDAWNFSHFTVNHSGTISREEGIVR